MGISLEAFPTLTDYLYEKCGFDKIKWMDNKGFLSFSYLNDQHISTPLYVEAIEKSKSSILKIKDTNYDWSPDNSNLSVKIKFDIDNPGELFGAKGIVPFNGELWIGVIMTSKKSSYRDAFIIKKKLDKSTCCGKKSIKIEGNSIDIDPGVLRGFVVFQVVFVLGNPGNLAKDEKHLATKVGTVLGSIAEFRVFIDGDGAIFPVKEENCPNSPLWRVKCDFDCIDITPFDENSFCLYLNEAHPDFKLLNLDGKNENTLLLDIAASSLEILFINVFSDDASLDILKDNLFDDDSIAFVVSQMMRYMHIQTSDSADIIHYKIRQYIMGKNK